jgi:hypothetical protein
MNQFDAAIFPILLFLGLHRVVYASISFLAFSASGYPRIVFSIAAVPCVTVSCFSQATGNELANWLSSISFSNQSSHCLASWTDTLFDCALQVTTVVVMCPR